MGTEHHLLLGPLREDGGPAATVLKGSGVAPGGVRASIECIVGRNEGDAGPYEEPLTPRAKRVLRLARQEALRLDHDHVCPEHLCPEHLLLGLIRDAGGGKGSGVAARVLMDLGVDRLEVRRRVHRELGTGGKAARSKPTEHSAARIRRTPSARSSQKPSPEKISSTR